QALGLEAAIEAMRKGIDRAARLIADGKAVAFGEVGRPHFPVPAEVLAACDDLLGYTMERAKELGCAVILHTEDPTPETFGEFATMASKAGLPPGRVVKHHSTPFTRPEDTHGLVPSILAKETLISGAVKGGPRFRLETDYIHDRGPLAAVVRPTPCARNTLAWLA